jgi:GNAT superfamily N-acetyltransferase
MTTLPCHVREATVVDAAELARLNAIFNGETVDPAQMATLLAAAHHVERAYLAEIEGRAVGFACLRLVATIFSNEPYAELTELFVEEPYRRQGVASALLQHVETVAQRAGADEFFLMTGFKNTGAHHFYHTVGYSLRCFTMHKELKQPAP